jgi:hypothetical protein
MISIILFWIFISSNSSTRINIIIIIIGNNNNNNNIIIIISYCTPQRPPEKLTVLKIADHPSPIHSKTSHDFNFKDLFYYYRRPICNGYRVLFVLEYVGRGVKQTIRFIWYRCCLWVELYFNSPICLHSMHRDQFVTVPSKLIFPKWFIRTMFLGMENFLMK